MATQRTKITDYARARVEDEIARAATVDSFVNYAHGQGIGSSSPLSTASYGFNPITRQRTMLEWMYRGSWICGIGVDAIPEDMTREGIEYTTELPPNLTGPLDAAIDEYDVWGSICETLQWGRLYGGALGVMLIDGQDNKTPFRVDTVGPGQFRGIVALDRWMVQPSNEKVVELGPRLGQPVYYTVMANAPALAGEVIHHSRIPFIHRGVRMPYQQALTENGWGCSIFERLYDRLVMFDSSTTGAAQLVYKAFLRTLKIKGLRDIVASGGRPLSGLRSYADNLRQYQSSEGLSVIDAEDELAMQTTNAFSGIDSILIQLGQQLSGALETPMVRLFGQSPAGLNSSGESDLRSYYDAIAKKQRRELRSGVHLVYQVAARSVGAKLPQDFSVEFKSLRQMNETEQSHIASETTNTVLAAKEAGLVSEQGAMRELKQLARRTGVFTNITDEDIAKADDTIGQAPGAEGLLGGLLGSNAQGGLNGSANGPQGATPAPTLGAPRRVTLQPKAAIGGNAGWAPGQGVIPKRPPIPGPRGGARP